MNPILQDRDTFNNLSGPEKYALLKEHLINCPNIKLYFKRKATRIDGGWIKRFPAEKRTKAWSVFELKRVGGVMRSNGQEDTSATYAFFEGLLGSSSSDRVVIDNMELC